MNVRLFPLVGGLVALALGGLLAVTGTALLPPGPVRVLAYAVAVLGALAMATLDVLTRATVDVSPATPSGGDHREGLATPGDDVDETLSSLSPEDRRGRLAVRRRVEAVGAGVLARRRNCSREAARELLESGEWTDDRRAAALFTDPAPSLGERVRSFVAGESAFRRRVAAATGELERIATAESADPAALTGSDSDDEEGADGNGDHDQGSDDRPAPVDDEARAATTDGGPGGDVDG